MSIERPPIPGPMKRQVRQRCGFGCVICGQPMMYDYHHIVPWETVRVHEEPNLTLLCRDHHGEVTAGLLLKEEIINANNNPFNLRLGVTATYTLNYRGENCICNMGNNQFEFSNITPGTYIFDAIKIDGHPVVSFIIGEDELLLHVNLFDRFNQPVFCVFDNELVLSTSSWDIQQISNRIIIREAPRNIFLELVFDPPNQITFERGRVMCNGVIVEINDFITIANNRIEVVNCYFRGVGISISSASPLGGLLGGRISVDRYPWLT